MPIHLQHDPDLDGFPVGPLKQDQGRNIVKLVRNEGKHGKYAVVRLQRLKFLAPDEYTAAKEALDLLAELGVLTYGEVGTKDEFFVMFLSDRYAMSGLCGYGVAAEIDGEEEYGKEILKLSLRAGPCSKFHKKPD